MPRSNAGLPQALSLPASAVYRHLRRLPEGFQWRPVSFPEPTYRFSHERGAAGPDKLGTVGGQDRVYAGEYQRFTVMLY